MEKYKHMPEIELLKASHLFFMSIDRPNMIDRCHYVTGTGKEMLHTIRTKPY